MSDLVEWLTNILDEDERLVERSVGDVIGTCIDNYGRVIVSKTRLLADIAAKRAILKIYRDFLEGPMPTSPWESGQLKAIAKAVQHLASAYADRPGYDERWWL